MLDRQPQSLNGSASNGRGKRFLDTVLSLRWKATGLIAILTISVTAAVSSYLVKTGRELARNQHDAQSVQMAAVLARAAAPMIAGGELDTLSSLAKEAADGSPLLYVIFSDLEGRQLFSAEHQDAGILRELDGDRLNRVPVPGKPIFHGGTRESPVFLDVTYPITQRDASEEPMPAGSTKLLGYVRIGMLADSWQQTMSSRLDLIIGVGLLAALVAIPMGFLLIRRVISPLDELAGAMLRFSQGDFEVRAKVNGRDEIGRLATVFNRMADQHKHTHDRIVRLNEELEKRVAQRTQQLRELASREPLTGLYNRRYFNEMLERRFSETLRYRSDLSCIMIDLDGFKAVNDAWGHHIGDELLILTATTILRQLRSVDVAARFGGDEFIILLPQTGADQARILSERVVEAFARDVAEELPHVHVSMSVGIASLPELSINDADSLIRTADHALYDAKASGKNRIEAATSVSKPAPA